MVSMCKVCGVELGHGIVECEKCLDDVCSSCAVNEHGKTVCKKCHTTWHYPGQH